MRRVPPPLILYNPVPQTPEQEKAFSDALDQFLEALVKARLARETSVHGTDPTSAAADAAPPTSHWRAASTR